jgi:serine/threonine protein kinase
VIVLEYCNHGDLYSLIDKEELKESEKRRFFRQIVSEVGCASPPSSSLFQLTGLEFIHSEGVTHRDIKPENILIGRRMIAKICDFGAAVPTGKLPWLIIAPGTRPYMSPELIQAKVCMLILLVERLLIRALRVSSLRIRRRISGRPAVCSSSC